MIEALNHAQQLPYPLQKLVLVWSTMHHFTQELRRDDWRVDYVQSEDSKTPLLDWIEQHHIIELRVMTPVDCPFTKLIQSLNLPCLITFIPNNRFIWQDQEFTVYRTRLRS